MLRNQAGLLRKTWPAVVMLLLVVVFFWPVTFEGKVLSGSDILLYSYEPWNAAASITPPGARPDNPELSDPVFSYVPNMTFALEVLRRGGMPLWNPLRMCGSPQLGDGTTAIFYPLNLLFLLFPFHFLTLATVKVLLSVFLMGLFAYIYGREIGLNSTASLIAAVIIMFCSRTVAWLEFYSFLDANMWFPLILFCYERYIKRNNFCYLILGCLLYGFSALALNPKPIVYFAQFLFVYVIFRGFTAESAGANRITVLSKSLLFFLLTVVIGLGVSAVETLPLVEMSRHTGRAFKVHFFSLKNLFAQINHVLFSPNSAYCHFDSGWRLFPLSSLVVPKFYGAAHDLLFWTKTPYAERVIYIGILPLVLAISAAVFVRNKFAKFFSFLAVFAFLLSVHMPIITELYNFIGMGIMGSNMGAIRTMFFSSFCLAFLAGFAVDSLTKPANPDRDKIVKLGVVLSLFLVVIFSALIFLALFKGDAFYNFVVGKTRFFGIDAYVLADCKVNLPSRRAFLCYEMVNFALAGFFAVFSLIYFLLQKKRKMSQGVSGFLCVGVVFFDLFLFGSKYNPAVPLKLAYPDTKTIEFLQNDKSLYRIFRYGNDKCLASGAVNVYEISDAGGRAMSLCVNNFYNFIKFIVPGSKISGLYPSYFYDPKGFNSPLLDLMNIKYVATSGKVPGLRSGGDDLETAYDFIEHLPESKIKLYKGSDFIRESSVSVEPFTIGEDGRPVIFSRGAAEVRYKLTIPPSAVLDFGIGLKPISWKEKKYYAFGDFMVKHSPLRYLYSKTNGVQFDIFLEADGKKEHIFSKFLDPVGDPSERKWFDYKIDLSAWAGKETEIIFKTSSAPESNGYYDWAGWSSPRFVIAGKKAGTTTLMEKFPLVWDREGVRIYENKGVLPRAYFVYQSKIFAKEDDLKKALQDYSFNPRDTVYLINEGEEFSSSLPFDEKDVKITDYSINEIAIEVNARSRGYLVLSDTYFQGWHAYVDGKETPILKADYVFRALPIDKGAHYVKFVYKPESFEKGKIASLLSLGLVGVLSVFTYVVRARKGKAA